MRCTRRSAYKMLSNPHCCCYSPSCGTLVQLWRNQDSNEPDASFHVPAPLGLVMSRLTHLCVAEQGPGQPEALGQVVLPRVQGQVGGSHQALGSNGSRCERLAQYGIYLHHMAGLPGRRTVLLGVLAAMNCLFYRLQGLAAPAPLAVQTSTPAMPNPGRRHIA
jgi:hypothetical protein